jgi:hypothetical protein
MSNFGPMFERVRAETAKMLGYNLDQLGLVQSVRLDRAIALRIEIDRVQAQQAQDQPIDIGRLSAASEQLEKLILLSEEQPSYDLSLLTDQDLQELERLLRKALLLRQPTN